MPSKRGISLCFACIIYLQQKYYIRPEKRKGLITFFGVCLNWCLFGRKGCLFGKKDRIQVNLFLLIPM
jgi:hypothetical protein